jgi:hypothetical protein
MAAFTRTPEDEKTFLEEDLYDALRWLFVGAVNWYATFDRPDICPHQRVLGMYTTFVQARALYDFFYKDDHDKTKHLDDALAAHFFASASKWKPDETELYKTYMKGKRPVNKRVFHLVYRRSEHSGGPLGEHEGPDHLKHQVLAFANDLRKLTKRFVNCVDDRHKDSAKSALAKALDDAERAARDCNVGLAWQDAMSDGLDPME